LARAARHAVVSAILPLSGWHTEFPWDHFIIHFSPRSGLLSPSKGKLAGMDLPVAVCGPDHFYILPFGHFSSMNTEMGQSLVIFSGLPGVGKSTLAERLARELRWPLLKIDDVIGQVPEDPGIEFWDSKVDILLDLVNTQLALGLDVIVDSVFMNMDRQHAQELARKYKARFLPIYVFVSNEQIWQERVTQRLDAANDRDIANWESIQHQREHFSSWVPGTALFIDSLNSVEKNFNYVLDFATKNGVILKPLGNIELSRGRYHR
jgi:predicted kinase